MAENQVLGGDESCCGELYDLGTVRSLSCLGALPEIRRREQLRSAVPIIAPFDKLRERGCADNKKRLILYHQTFYMLYLCFLLLAPLGGLN